MDNAGNDNAKNGGSQKKTQTGGKAFFMSYQTVQMTGAPVVLPIY